MGTTEVPLISVIDDDQSVVEGIVALMESVGYATAGFGSAEDFLSSSRSHPACLILDVRMPGMGGLELQRRLAAERDETPIIFITAHGDDEVSAEAARRGAVAFLRKPFSQAALLAAVRSALAPGEQQLKTSDGATAKTRTPADMELGSRDALRRVTTETK